MIIHLISCPRNLSTALMYSFAQHSKVKVVDEPFYAIYLKKTGLKHPGFEEVLKSQPTKEKEVLDRLFQLESEHDIVFIKNMSKHLEQLEELDFMQEWHNVFYVREPEKVIHSFSKVIKLPTKADIGYAAMKEMYNLPLRYKVVLNSTEMLNRPGNLLSKLCDKCGLDFEENMLRWERGPKPEDGVWAKYWYRSVHNSEGFMSQENKEIKLPIELQPLLGECVRDFNYINQFRIR